MQKLDVWHVVWMLVLVVGAVLLGITFVIALNYRQSSTFANVASIWGLFDGLIGFIVTIYTLFETQRVTREAQLQIQKATVDAQLRIEQAAKQAQEAVTEAHEQTRLVLERVRMGVRDANYWTLLMWLKNLRQAAMLLDWPRALLLAEECPAIGERLVNAEGLTDTERTRLRERIDDVRMLHAFHRDERIPDSANKLLAIDSAQARSLDDLIGLLEALGGKLYHEPTKAPS